MFRSAAVWIGCLVGAAVLGTPLPAEAQCALEQSEDRILGLGSSARMAVDPVTEEPVVIYDTRDRGLVYRHYYGPDWGREVSVDSGGIELPAGEDGVLTHGVDLVLDRYGRPRVALLDAHGVYHTRYTDGWSPPETLVEWTLGAIGLSSVHVRLERDPGDRAHVVAWTGEYDGSGRRAFHAFDGGEGFEPTTEFEQGGWTPRAATDDEGNLHVTMFGFFDDPDNPSGLHQSQAYYWKWTLADGWPDEYEVITDEPNPPTGNGAGPVGFWPEITVDAWGTVHVAYPMHDTEDAAAGRMHYVADSGGGWFQHAPEDLFDCNGHGGKPVIVVDHRGTKLVAGLVYAKHYAVDFGDGFGGAQTWNGSSSHWQFHDMVQTRGLFWHVFVPVYWSDGEPGDVTIHTFRKVGTCPGVSDDDLDDDGVDDSVDLCPGVPDPAQWDTDGDGVGDGCDPDDDGDGFLDSEDVCPRLADPDQADSDGDGLGDACSNLVDLDGDGFLAPYECDDAEPAAFPGNVEDCGDGIDNDCDGDVDGEDEDCPPGDDDDDDDDASAGDDDDGSPGPGGGGDGCDCGEPDAEGHAAKEPMLAVTLAAIGLVSLRRRPSRQR